MRIERILPLLLVLLAGCVSNISGECRKGNGYAVFEGSGSLEKFVDQISLKNVFAKKEGNILLLKGRASKNICNLENWNGNVLIIATPEKFLAVYAQNRSFVRRVPVKTELGTLGYIYLPPEYTVKGFALEDSSCPGTPAYYGFVLSDGKSMLLNGFYLSFKSSYTPQSYGYGYYYAYDPMLAYYYAYEQQMQGAIAQAARKCTSYFVDPETASRMRIEQLDTCEEDFSFFWDKINSFFGCNPHAENRSESFYGTTPMVQIIRYYNCSKRSGVVFAVLGKSSIEYAGYSAKMLIAEYILVSWTNRTRDYMLSFEENKEFFSKIMQMRNRCFSKYSEQVREQAREASEMSDMVRRTFREISEMHMQSMEEEWKYQEEMAESVTRILSGYTAVSDGEEVYEVEAGAEEYFKKDDLIMGVSGDYDRNLLIAEGWQPLQERVEGFISGEWG